MVCEPVCLGVLITLDVIDGKGERPGQLAAGPVQRVKPRAAAPIEPGHLLDDDLGVRVNVQGHRFGIDRMLQGLKQRYVLRHIVVLMPDPLGNSDGFATGVLNHDADARGARIPV